MLLSTGLSLLGFVFNTIAVISLTSQNANERQDSHNMRTNGFELERQTCHTFSYHLRPATLPAWVLNNWRWYVWAEGHEWTPINRGCVMIVFLPSALSSPEFEFRSNEGSNLALFDWKNFPAETAFSLAFALFLKSFVRSMFSYCLLLRSLIVAWVHSVPRAERAPMRQWWRSGCCFGCVLCSHYFMQQGAARQGHTCAQSEMGG